MTLDEFSKWGDELQEFSDKNEPGFLRTAADAVRTNIVGGNTFINMVERKHIMAPNEGKEDFYKSEDFMKTVLTERPDITAVEIDELRDAKNSTFLKQSLQNQKNYYASVKRLEEAGASSLPYEFIAGAVDPTSWLLGGAIFKGAKASVGTIQALQTGASKVLGNMAVGSFTAATTIGTTEAFIQQEADVNNRERVQNTALIAGAFGLGLPLVADTFTHYASGAGRQSLASNFQNGVNATQGTSSLRRMFSMTSADQGIHDSFSPTLKEEALKAVTPVNAPKDEFGNIIVVQDTAMDYVEAKVGKELEMVSLNLTENSKKFENKREEQSSIDGKEFDTVQSNFEQKVHNEIARTPDKDLINEYKQATGVAEFEIEKEIAKVDSKADTLLNEANKQFELASKAIDTQKAKRIESEVTTIVNNRVSKLQQEASVLQTKVQETTNKVTDLENTINNLQARSNVPGNLGIMPNKKDSSALRKALLEKEKVQKELDNFNSKMEELNNKNKDITTEELLKVQAKVNKEFEVITNQANKGVKKAQREADKLKASVNRDPFSKLPEDFFDVIRANRMKGKFDSGEFQVPKHLEYIQDFYVSYAKDGTKYPIKGLAGKDGRGYNNIEYNFEYMLRNPNEAKDKLRQMLLEEDLNKYLIQRGLLKEEDLLKEVDKMYNMATDKAILNNYIDGSRGSTATSPLGQRRLRLKRSLFPEMFIQDAEVKLSKYADKMTGRIALKKIYDMDADDITGRLSTTLEAKYKKIAEEARDNGATPKQIEKDVDNAKAIFETILGSRKYQDNSQAFANSSVRYLKKTASALYSAGFVKWALVEPTVAIMRYGLKPVLKNYVPAYKTLVEHLKNAKSNDPMVKLLRNVGLSTHTLRAQRHDRYDNYEVTPTTSKAEHWLDTASHVGRKYSGFNFINDFNDSLAMGSAITFLEEVVLKGKLTKAEENMFGRFGLGIDDINAMGKEAIIKDASGRIAGWNPYKWKDPELTAKFERYVSRATRDTVMRADGTRTHRVQSDMNNPIASLALQFTQMPMALSDRILLNLADEASAKTVVGMVSAVAFTFAMLELEDLALVASGAQDVATDYETLLVRAVTRSPFAGIVPNFIDVGLMVAGQSPLGSSYAPKTDLASLVGGAGLGAGNKVVKALLGLHDGVNETDVANILKIVPIINSYAGIGQLMKGEEAELIKQGKFNSDVSYQYSNPLSKD